MRSIRTLSIVVMTVGASVTLGATATFTPVGPTTVSPGTDVKFEIALSVGSISSFDAADVVIGTADASDLSFIYAPEWDAAFFNITPPTLDPPFYAQGVFVGGNNPVPVGTSLKLGTITLKTTGMAEGTYTVMISSATDGGVSKLSRGDLRDFLNGTATFTILCFFNPDCDSDVDAEDYRALRSCLTGPAGSASPACRRFDRNLDGHVDLLDVGAFFAAFSGAH